MAWTAQNLFVRGDRAVLIDELARLVTDPAHQADRDGLVTDAPPALIVGPVCDGWVPVLGLRGWVRDPPALARSLSEAARLELVVSSEVLGACYRLRHTENRDGQQSVCELVPDCGWDDAEIRGPMPLYRDVEQLGYAMLRDLGVPPTVALIGTQPPVDGSDVDLGQSTSLVLGDGRRVERRTSTLRATRYADADDAPVIVRQVGRDLGLHLFDDRFVEGEPTPEAVNRLLQLEAKILARARRLYGSQLSLTMTYYNGCYQDEMDELLLARGCQVLARPVRRSTVPWWQFWRYFGRWR